MDTPTEIETPKTPSTGADVEAPWKKLNVSTIDDFRELEQGAQIELQRLSPNPIKGYCGHLIVPDGGISDVLEEIKQTFGGGRYQLRGKHLSANGRLNYVGGSVQVDVAGYPRDQGREWINGVWRPIAVPLAPVAPVAPQQSGNSTSGGMETLMTTFLTQALQGALSGDSGINLGEMPALITAISQLRGSTPERDSFSDLERTLSLVDKLERRRQPEVAPAPAAADGDGMGNILQLLAAKFLGPQTQQPPVNYAPPPSHFAPPTAEQMWAHAQGNIPGPPPPGYGQNQPDWTPTQPPIQPNFAGQPPSQPPPPPSAPAAQSQSTAMPQDESTEYEPLTVDEVLRDVGARDEKSRAEWIDELCTKIGISDALAAQMFPQQGNGSQPPGNPPSSEPQRFDQSYERTE